MTTQTPWLDSYRANKNAEDLARQAAPVKAAHADILRSLKDIENELYWSLSGDASDACWPDRLLEQAHQLVDQAHAFRASLVAHPAPQQEIES
jgi:hypothetical protein